MTGPVRSVSHAFAILRLLADSGPMTLSDIGRFAGLSPSSCLNLLRTLVAEGVLDRDAGTRYYDLAASWRAADALRDSPAARLVDRARAPMARFARATETALGLWKIVSRDRMQLTAHARSESGMHLSLADNQRQPIGGGAAGRAIAAEQGADEAELARRHALVRWQADLPLQAYVGQVWTASQKGFAVDQGFAHRGVGTVAVGITRIAPGFAISASFLASSRGDAEIDALGVALIDLREALETLAA